MQRKAFKRKEGVWYVSREREKHDVTGVANKSEAVMKAMQVMLLAVGFADTGETATERVSYFRKTFRYQKKSLSRLGMFNRTTLEITFS